MYGDLVPVFLQDELIFIRDSNTRQSWRIADITAEVIQFHKANTKQGDPLPELQLIYQAVGMFVGRSSRTVREYHAIGRFFDPEIREQFGVLAFAHFRHAAQLGERAIEALQWCVEQGDELNRPATVDAMIAHFSPPQTKEEPESEDSEKEPETIWQQMFRQASTGILMANTWLNQDLPSRVLSAVQDYVDAAQALVERLPMSARK